MNFSADILKKEYKKDTDALRAGNLRNLRENIAKLSLSDFSRETGMTKNDISLLENSKKTLSLTHMLTYKKYFSENHRINLSMDYLMGFTDIMENNNMNYQKEIGLSNDSLECLKYLKEHSAKYNALSTLDYLMQGRERFRRLLNNIQIIISEEDASSKEAKPIMTIDIKNQEGNIIETVAIDNRILKSYALSKIKEIIESYSK